MFSYHVSNGQSALDENKMHCLTEQDSRLAHYIALLWGLMLLLTYLATFGTKSDVIFLLGDPNFLQGNEILRVSHIVFEIPFWVIWGLGYFWGIWLVLVQNLASYSCSVTPISYGRRNCTRISHRFQDPHFGHLGVWSYFWGI